MRVSPVCDTFEAASPVGRGGRSRVRAGGRRDHDHRLRRVVAGGVVGVDRECVVRVAGETGEDAVGGGGRSRRRTRRGTGCSR